MGQSINRNLKKRRFHSQRSDTSVGSGWETRSGELALNGFTPVASAVKGQGFAVCDVCCLVIPVLGWSRHVLDVELR